MTTLRDVAQAAGVDISTASRALAGSPLVAEATRARVASVAQQLGWRRNEAARRLRTGSTDTVWFIAGGLDGAMEREPVLRGVERLSQAGYDALMALHRNDPVITARLLTHLDRGLADGAVIIPDAVSAQAHPLLRGLIERRFPLVFLDRHPEDIPAPTVTTDNAAAVHALVAAGRQAGVERWVVAMSSNNAVAHLRERTAVQALAGEPWTTADAVDAAWCGSARIGLLGTGFESFLRGDWLEGITPDRRVACLFDRWDPARLPATQAFVAEQDFAAMADAAVDRLLAMLRDGAWHDGITRIPLARVAHASSGRP